MDKRIHDYFLLGLNYSEILDKLKSDGQNVSLRTLKRTLKRLNLYRRVHFSDIIEVALFVMNEMQQSGMLHGYKMMHLKCLQNGYVVTQQTIRELLLIIDPIGVQQRRRNRLQRRIYSNLGPNYLWHIDGYDKLKPFGICIHGAVDGFSRYIIWLEAHRTNNDPKVVAGYFINAVRNIKGCPARIRADMGTENCYVRQMIMFLRSLGNEHNTETCYLEGSSTHNQRIEHWWGFLRRHNAQYWMDMFGMLASIGCYTGNFVDKAILQFCFMNLIQEELNEIASLWNSHRIRPSKNQTSPNGRPVVMYTCPERFGVQDYLCNVTDNQIDACSEECIFKGPMVCEETVFELCTFLMNDSRKEMPTCGEEAVVLYQFLRTEVLDGLSVF
ncbi:uncharacterized protein LOC132749519 [Ruditapes philippinarum]|uniref:uncharacterized protein LOC132749519 n=1 Tax=Ruditapes philippinarum TaxID=129788 RepID=UPI00295BEEBE|nr:uncharacterized protein LOC132749519 [Ruditapes philippinarum]